MSDTDFRPDDADIPERAAGSTASEQSADVPEADVAEQRRDLVDHDAEPAREVPFDVDPADAAEQSRVVDYDEDDYR